jgi:serine/threonine-protein kinase
MSNAGSSHQPLELTPLIQRSGGAPAPVDGGCDPDERTVISQRPPSPAASPARQTAPAELGKLLAGERLNHFELREFVGGGGMGAVFRAVDTMLNREVALKVLSRDQGADEETRRRFQNEAQSAARLDHENIARVYYVGEDRGLNYIVFEFIEGVNLRELVVERKGPLPLAEAISYTLQVAEALAHASSRDVVHRDIKPSNVIITAEGRAKLVDMGLARLHQVNPDAEELTASGVTLGTFDYISPEQARDPRSADVRSDIYSLGCTLYYMLTARPPFPEGTVLQKLLQHNSDEPPDPREFSPALPEEVSALVRKMLAKDPRRRFQNASELIAEMLLLAEQLGCPTPAARGLVLLANGPAAVSTWERHVPWVIPVVALLCIVLVMDRAWPSLEGEPARPSFARGGPAPSTQPPPGQRSRSDQRRPAAGGAGANRATPADFNARGAEPGRSAQPSGVPGSGAGVSQSNSGADDGSDSASRIIPEPGSHLVDPSGSNHDSIESHRAASGGAARVASDPVSGAIGRASAAGALGASSQSPSVAPAGDAVSRASSDTPADPPNVRSGGSTARPGTTSTDLSQRPAAAQAPDQAASASQAAATAAPGPADDVQPGVLYVSETVRGPQHFATLREACAKARKNEVIELQYSGRRLSDPIALANQKLTIRAVEPFRPVIVFRPSEPDPITSPRSMITVAGGSLKLVNVSVELEVPRDLPADNWSLFETQLADSISLEKCVLTVRNASDQRGAYHQGVAFFRVKSAPGVDSMMASKGMMPLEAVEVRLDDCIARGEATFLRAGDLQPFRLSWDNGLLAISERLLSTEGAVSSAAGGGGQGRLELKHLTAVLGKGLCRLSNTADAPAQLDIEIACGDSILVAAADASLVEQLGVSSLAGFQQRFRWNGEWNLYQGFSTFWRIQTDTSRPPLEWLFGPWRDFWKETREVQPSLSQVVWARYPKADRPMHTHTAADYALDQQAIGNPARSRSSDGLDAGLVSAELPSVPDDRLPATEPAD